MKQYLSIDELINDLPALASEAKEHLAGLNCLYLLEIRQGPKVFLKLENGCLSVLHECADKPCCTVSAAGDTLLGLLQGKIRPLPALMTGKISIRGDSAALMKLISHLK